LLHLHTLPIEGDDDVRRQNVLAVGWDEKPRRLLEVRVMVGDDVHRDSLLRPVLHVGVPDGAAVLGAKLVELR
jgi:hypothetical protein